MKNVNSRQKKVKLNICVTFMYQIVSAICGLIVPRILLRQYGSEAYGATASILQFLGYITLLEGGIGGVARAALYKPLSEKNNKKISEVIFEIKKFFRIIAYIFCAYVLLLACGFKAISHIEVLDWMSTFLLVIVISISTFAQYFIGISYSVLLQADQKSYIGNAVSALSLIANAVLVAILVSLDADLILVKFVSSCVYALKPIVLWLYVKRNYRLPPSNGGCVLRDKWVGLGQHIAFFVHSNTDVLILTLFANLKYVAVYSVYNMITSQIQKFTSSFASGMEAVFGDMYAQKEISRLNATFNLYETMISFFSNILFSITAVMIVPFVQIYTRGMTDADYILPAFGVLLTAATYISCISAPYSSVVIAAGHFRQTQWAAYGEAFANLLISVILVKNMGLIGVAIGTVVATFYKLVFYAVYLGKNILRRNITQFLIRETTNLLTIALIFAAGKQLLTFFDITGYFQWALAAIVVAFFACMLTVTVNLIFYRKDFVLLMKKIMYRS